MTRSLLASLSLIACAAASMAHAAAAPEAGPVATDPTADQISAWIAADQPSAGPLSDGPALPGPLMSERRIHGEVGAGVSNRGYGGYAAVQMPVGDASEVDVAVAGEHFNGNGRFRGGNSRSLMLGVNLDSHDIGKLIGRDKCNVPRWGVRLKHDPVVLPDGRCVKRDDTAQAELPSWSDEGARDGSGHARDPF